MHEMNTERRHFLCTCLNAAVQLYGFITYKNFIDLYAHYAAKDASPLCDPVTPEELDALVEDVFTPLTTTYSTERPYWFASVDVKGEKVLVNQAGLEFWKKPSDDDEENASDILELDPELVADGMASRLVPSLKILKRAEFLRYADPEMYEETRAAKRLARYLFRTYSNYSKEDIDTDIGFLDTQLRGQPLVLTALITVQENLKLRIDTREAFDELFGYLLEFIRNVRSWRYGGYTEAELVRNGVLETFLTDDGEDTRNKFWRMYKNGLEEEDAIGNVENQNANTHEVPLDKAASDLSEEEKEFLAGQMLPPAEYPEKPIDFNFVNDAFRRIRIVRDTTRAAALACEFVKDVLLPKVPLERVDEMWKILWKSLSVPGTSRKEAEDAAHDVLSAVTMDYLVMMDDQDGEPLVNQVLANMQDETLPHRLGARYFANYRYSWLVIEAIKSGVGFKCRNLMTGEHLFLSSLRLFHEGLSKGMTICVGIAPVGGVYLMLGELGATYYENPEAELQRMRKKLKLPLEGRLDLSFADQARFAVATIRELFKREGLRAFKG